AMTEPDAGSDLQAMRTTAVKDGDHYIINGQKIFISLGMSCELVIVAAKTDPQAVPPHKGISLILVENGTPGFIKVKKLNKMGAHTQDTAELLFEDCRVPTDNILGEEGAGFAYLIQKLQKERLIAALWAQAGAESMLQMGIDYAHQRKVFGKPVSNFQHNSFKIVEMATEVELGRAFMDELIQDHLDGKDIVKKVSMAKWWLTEMANRVAYDSLQLHGGFGYMEEYPICRAYRDIRVSSIAAGTTEIMKHIIARMMKL
ncbi:MAG: acyl-CoA dehydrogenase family protein, partial [Thermodesulfobacteriota bacterium]|nr:acyl-CoA dehydrogenase family protein [Thermodesulfobacteriota bacterium]